MAQETFTVGDLTATFVDNAEHGDHRAGYNGISSLKHRTGKRSIFVEKIAGMNFEHIFSGENEEDRDVFFEPRVAPMNFRKLGEGAVELHQPPTPTWHLESWTTFRMVAPHYIDFEFRCQAKQHVFEHGYIGLFWASYINAPLDKSMYFWGGLEGQQPLWQQLCTPKHNENSTVLFKDDDYELKWREGSRDALYKNFSPLRFHEPFFYGNFEDLTWAVMFDQSERIRLTHSPSGGGVNAELKANNPAWDFQFIVPNYDVMTDYGFKARAFLQPRITRDQMMEEFQTWKDSLD